MQKLNLLLIALTILTLAVIVYLQNEEIKEYKHEIGLLQTQNSKLLERKIYYDTIQTYIFKGFYMTGKESK